MYEKTCTQCHINKSLKNFPKDKLQKSGLRPNCKQCQRQKVNLNYQLSKELLKEKYIKNRLDKIDRVKKYYSLNKIKINKRHNIYIKNRRQSDLNFKLRINLARRILLSLHGKTKSKKTLDLLGCSIEFLKQHLESQFKLGMSWSNYGFYGWHIDHIKPCSKFDLTDPKQQKECFHYTNLQPLLASENWAKRDKYVY